MKVTFDIDCTPEEARKFLGLPDVAPMQDAMMQELQKKMKENVEAMDAETIMKTWFEGGMKNMTEMQKMFWGQMGVDSGEKKS